MGLLSITMFNGFVVSVTRILMTDDGEHDDQVKKFLSALGSWLSLSTIQPGRLHYPAIPAKSSVTWPALAR